MSGPAPTGPRGVLAALQGQLVVSCQAAAGHPLADVGFIVALCRCAALGGAAGLRVEGTVNVQAARKATGLPVIGLRKIWGGAYALSDARPAITPTTEDALALEAAGADVVALEATEELHGEGTKRFVESVRRELRALIMADVSTLEEGLAAYEAGADVVGTTLSGYTAGSAGRLRPDLALVESLAARGVPTVAEGHIVSPAQARGALEAGALFVVVGKAITDPLSTTEAFVSTMRGFGDRR